MLQYISARTDLKMANNKSLILSQNHRF